MRRDTYRTKLRHLRRMREVMHADEVRRAENHAFYLSLLPPSAKTSITIQSKANQQ